MTLSARLLCVFVAVASVRSATGYVESLATCTTVPEEGRSMYETFRSKVDDCSYAHGYVAPESHHTAEMIRALIAPYCATLAEHRECFDTAMSGASACLDESQQTQLRLYSDYRLLSYEAACARSGENLVYVITTVRQLQDDFLTRCSDNARAAVDADHVADVNGELIREYKIGQKYRECLRDLKGVTEHDALIDIVTATQTRVLDTMKCSHEGNDVLCKTIVD